MARRVRIPSVHRTTIDLDVNELQLARETLGTTTTKDTVNRALREVNRTAALRRAAALVRHGDLNIVQPDDLASLRRSRVQAEP
jgi:Arc/MetJ family transcription regulator